MAENKLGVEKTYATVNKRVYKLSDDQLTKAISYWLEGHGEIVYDNTVLTKTDDGYQFEVIDKPQVDKTIEI